MSKYIVTLKNFGYLFPEKNYNKHYFFLLRRSGKKDFSG